MSSPKSENVLHVKLGPSRRLALALLLMHGGAAGLIPTLPMAPWVSLMIAGAVSLSLAYGLATRALLRSPHALVQLVWEPDGRWTLLCANGSALEGTLIPEVCYVLPQVVVLGFRTARGRRSALVLPDAVDPVTFRRLRARLAAMRL